MEYFFTYQISDGNEVVRIGKGHCFEKTGVGVLRYLRSRYGAYGWSDASYSWHNSEAAALKKENFLIDGFIDSYGELPFWNKRRGGAGRQIYKRCKSWLSTGAACRNNALVGNYGYCGVHR
jgi:hypothetical protein